MSKNKEKKQKRKWFWYFFIVGIVWKLAKKIFFRNKKLNLDRIEENFKEFVKKEENEAHEYVKGKENFKQFCRDSCSIFVDYFIPHECNDYHPKLLRPRSLAILGILLAFIKFSFLGYLYFIFPQRGEMSQELVTKVITLVNEERRKENIHVLKVNQALNKYALAKAEDMVLNDYFAHYGPDGKKPWEWINRSEYRYLFVGENLAMNFTSAESVHRALMNSPSHKKNIMSDKYYDVGMAMATGMINGKETNVLVQFFGREQGTALALETESTDKTAGTTEEAAVEKEKNNEAPVAVLSESEQALPETKTEIKSEPIAKAQEKTSLITKEISGESTFTSRVDSSEENEIQALTPSSEIETKKIAKAPVQANVSPNFAIESYQMNEIKTFKNTDHSGFLISTKVAKVINLIFIAILVLLVASLAANILIKITVQHKPAIIHTVILIIFVSGLIYFKFHILESGLPNLFII